jgi:type IV pilus assembly protein PilB
VAKARIGELLVEAKVITQAQLDLVLALPRDRKLGQHLVERGFVSEAALTQTLSLQLSVPWVALSHVDFSRELLNRVPEELADRYTLVPVLVRTEKRQGPTLYVALDDPTNEAALAEVANASGLPTRAMIASRSDILAAIRVYYRGEPADVVPVAPGSDVELPSALPVEPRAATLPSRPPGRPSAPPPRPSAPPPRPSAPPPEEPAPSEVPDPQEDEPVPSSRFGPAGRMIAMTLLDGTTVKLPARRRSEREMHAIPRAWTTGDLVVALRAVSEGKSVADAFGQEPRWELLFGALLTLMIRKGLIADWEFVDELRKISSSASDPK